MPQVRMRRQISGTRNGVHWPPPGEVVDVSEDEAATLVRQGTAESVEADESEPDGEAEGEPAEPPARGDRKGAWVDYAVARGMDRAEAADMTKDELVARFDVAEE